MTPDPGTPSRWRADLPVAVAVVVGCALLAAPFGLLWSAIAPRLQVGFDQTGPVAVDLESTKAFIGADGTYLLVMVAAGLFTGVVAWLFARQAGPWTVGALAVGGLVAGLISAKVGLMPGTADALLAVQQGSFGDPPFELYLGRLDDDKVPHLRASWAALGWPVGALGAFLVGALARPEELD